MKILGTSLFLLVTLLILSSCKGDGSLSDEAVNGEGAAAESAAETFDPTKPPFESDRDPNVVYVDTEYIEFQNNVGTFSGYLLGREIRQHQFDLGAGDIITFYILSMNEKTMVTILNSQGQRLVRQAFGGTDDPFRWNERFSEPGLYTVQLSLVHDVAAAGQYTQYELKLEKSR